MSQVLTTEVNATKWTSSMWLWVAVTSDGYADVCKCTWLHIRRKVPGDLVPMLIVVHSYSASLQCCVLVDKTLLWTINNQLLHTCIITTHLMIFVTSTTECVCVMWKISDWANTSTLQFYKQFHTLQSKTQFRCFVAILSQNSAPGIKHDKYQVCGQ